MIGEDLIQNAEERLISGMDQLIVERWEKVLWILVCLSYS